MPILHKLEPGLDLERPLVLPNDNGHTRTDVELQRLGETLIEAERRKIFITLKLPVLLDHPEVWPRGELDRTLRQAVDLTIAIPRIQIAGYKTFEYKRYFSDPWQWVDAATKAANAASIQTLGALYAGEVGCELVDYGIDVPIASFWLGYEIENIRLGHGSCNALARLNLPQVYQAIVHPADAALAAR